MTTTKLISTVTLGLVAAVAATSPALAAAPKQDTRTAAKVERVMAKGHAKKSVKSLKRQLKRAGMKKGQAPRIRKVNRSFCAITYYYDGAIAICPNGFFNDVYVDFYNDFYGWLYWGWY